jgi:hypothetical protein
MKGGLTFAMIGGVLLAATLLASARPALADETQAMVGLRFGDETTAFAELRYLPTVNTKRGVDRVDLQRLGVRFDGRGVTVNAVVLVKDGDGSFVKAMEFVPSLTLTGGAVLPALEATVYPTHSSFTGAWPDALRVDARSEGRLGLRLADGRTVWFAKASAVTGPFANNGFAGSKVYPFVPVKSGACRQINAEVDRVTGKLLTLRCGR